MIRVMTLNAETAPSRSSSWLHAGLEPMLHQQVDVLCCQSVHRPTGESMNATRSLLDTFGMTYSCFAPNRTPSTVEETAFADAGGLAIMTGKQVWMLNSGSFLLTDQQGTGEWVTQFAHIRKATSSALIVNVQLASAEHDQDVQLRSLFAHPLLKEQYGAVVLCSDKRVVLSPKNLKAAAGKSNYVPCRSLSPADNGPDQTMVTIFVAKTMEYLVAATTSPILGNNSADEWTLPGQSLGVAIDLEMIRVSRNKQCMPFLPLSFREQWLGCKENYNHRAFAL